MADLNGKVALITGAGRAHGIGRACAVRLARDGADIVVTDICRQFDDFPDYSSRLGKWDELNETADLVHALGQRALTLRLDVSSSKEVEEAVAKSVETFGRIDILVNNAGIVMPGQIVDLSEEAWEKVQAVNLKGVFLCSKAVAKHMIERGGGGKIINISSREGKAPLAGNVAYSTSKAGVISFTMGFALEVARHGINVNAICPGSVDTLFTAQRYERMSEERRISVEEARKQFAQEAGIPLGRTSTPDELAGLVVFLASSESDFMTGQAINFSGGREMR